MYKLYKTIQAHILDIFFPPVCLHCRTSIPDQKQWLCKKCRGLLHLNSSFFCPQCDARKPSLVHACHTTPYVLAPACFYHDPIPSLIYHYKYKGIRNVERILAALLILYIQHLDMNVKDFLITYIPLHPSRQRERGFNQAQELARIVSNYYGTPFASFLAKTAQHPPQAQTNDYAQRERNIANTFSIINRDDIKGKNIIVVDDISTSGATMREASRVLKSAGAKKIIGLVIAKA